MQQKFYLTFCVDVVKSLSDSKDKGDTEMRTNPTARHRHTVRSGHRDSVILHKGSKLSGPNPGQVRRIALRSIETTADTMLMWIRLGDAEAARVAAAICAHQARKLQAAKCPDCLMELEYEGQEHNCDGDQMW